jgi:acetyltransferase-like isoleucine patch superfamily enzyme
VIKDNVVVGVGASLLPGVTIGEGSTIGAGAVVTKDVPPNSTVIGMPAKVTKTKGN